MCNELVDEGTVALHEAFKHCVLCGVVSFRSCTKLQTEIVPVLSPDKVQAGEAVPNRSECLVRGLYDANHLLPRHVTQFKIQMQFVTKLIMSMHSFQDCSVCKMITCFL